MNIVFIAPECFPYTAESSFSHFVYGLSKGVEQAGNNVKVIIPRYGSIDPAHFLIERLPTECKFDFKGKPTTAITYKGILPDSLVGTFLIDNQNYFSNSKAVYLDNGEDSTRFSYFCSGALSVLNSLRFVPDLIHLVGSHMSSCTSLIRDVFEYRKYSDAKIVFSFSHGDHLLNHLTGSTKTLLSSANAVTVLSSFHALEIEKKSQYAAIKDLLGQGCFTGIACGLDGFIYDPKRDTTIAQNYSKAYFSAGKKKCKEAIVQELGFNDVQLPLFTLIPQLDSKQDEGSVLDLLSKSLNLNLQMILLCKKNHNFSNRFFEVAKQFDNLKVVHEEAETKIFAGTDFLVYLKANDPSSIQLQAGMKYGAIPIAHKDSAARDIIVDIDSNEADSNGFYLDSQGRDTLLIALKKAISLYKNRERWPGIVKNTMGFNFNIASCAEKYIDLYQTALNSSNKSPLIAKG